MTTVQKITGAMSILMSLMKPSPSGFMDAPISGKKKPKRTPITMAARTCTYSTLYNGFFIQSLLINGINPRWLRVSSNNKGMILRYGFYALVTSIPKEVFGNNLNNL
jgi:hypothetical protein